MLNERVKHVECVYSVTPDGIFLTLLRLSKEDSGTYTCLAVSPAGQESRLYTLFVLGKFCCISDFSSC
jgi:hypothetical protein